MKQSPEFLKRSDEAEWMDDLSLSEAELHLALGDIALVNKVLGGHAISLRGLKPLLHHRRGKPVRVVDAGCGNGEFLRYLSRYCRRHQIKAELIGWDRNLSSLESGRAMSVGMEEIRFEQKDLLSNPPLPGGGPIVVCNLFLHHFTDAQIVAMLDHWLKGGCTAIVVNELHRNRMAYYLFRLFGAIFMKSRIARHDGQVSIQRGFLKRELQGFSRKLGLDAYSIQWHWAFRYLWVMKSKSYK